MSKPAITLLENQLVFRSLHLRCFVSEHTLTVKILPSDSVLNRLCYDLACPALYCLKSGVIDVC